jgi:hypothetical protein
MGACGRNQDTFLRFDPMLDVGMLEHGMGPANTIYPEGCDRDTLFARCSVHPVFFPIPCGSGAAQGALELCEGLFRFRARRLPDLWG